MNDAKLSFYDMFDQRRITSLAWTSLKPGETSAEKHVWLYNRRNGSDGSTASRIRVSALGLTPSGETVCLSKYIEVRSDGIAGDPEGSFTDDAQGSFTPIGGSLLEAGKYLDIGDIPPLGGRRLIFRLNIPGGFTEYGPVLVNLVAGFREEQV